MSKRIVPLTVSSHYFHKHYTGGMWSLAFLGVKDLLKKDIVCFLEVSLNLKYRLSALRQSLYASCKFVSRQGWSLMNKVLRYVYQSFGGRVVVGRRSISMCRSGFEIA